MHGFARHIYLHLPGLLGPLPKDAMGLLEPSAVGAMMSRLLSRAKRRSVPAHEVDQQRLRLFGLALPSAGDLPVGPLSALGDGLSSGDSCLYRADPVHLVPDRDRLLVMPAGRLALPPDGVSQFMRDFNDLFAADGMLLEAPHPDRWFLRLATTPAIRTTPLSRVMGKPMGDYLPTGADCRAWISHLNSIQMLLHASDLNRQREAAGHATINGIWLWGGGRLPPVPSSRCSWGTVCSDEPLLRGLAQHAGIAHRPLQPIHDLLESNLDGAVLVDLGMFPAVRDGESFTAWESEFHAFLMDWIEPLATALKSGMVDRLELDTGKQVWTLTPSSLRRFWKRTPPLTHWLEQTTS